MFVAGAALLADQTWARITGVVLAAFMIMANFVYLPYYPVWAIVLIALNAFVIWALLTPRHYRLGPVDLAIGSLAADAEHQRRDPCRLFTCRG